MANSDAGTAMDLWESDTDADELPLSTPAEAPDTERNLLRKNTLACIVPYKDEESKNPPFFGRKCRGGLCGGFADYGRVAMNRYLNSQIGHDERLARPREAIEGFKTAYSAWDTPVITIEDSEIIRWGDYDDCDFDIVVRPRAGRTYVRRVLEPKRIGTFPFLKLPAEIRNTIYEMLYTFPEDGLIITHERGPRPVRRAEEEHLPTMNLCHYDWGTELDLTFNSHNLALLAVNKRIYAEAMPFFYSVNHFHFRFISAWNDKIFGGG